MQSCVVQLLIVFADKQQYCSYFGAACVAVAVLAIVAVSFVGLAVCLAIICCGIYCLRRSVLTHICVQQCILLLKSVKLISN